MKGGWHANALTQHHLLANTLGDFMAQKPETLTTSVQHAADAVH